MSQHYLFGFLVLLLCCFLEASSRPSDNEPEAALKLQLPIKEILEKETQEEEEEKEERSLPYDEIRYTEPQDENTKEILDKIKAINNGLKKPNRQYAHYNNYNSAQPHTGGSYVLDKETLEKIQQIIASGKLHGLTETKRHQGSSSNELFNPHEDIDSRYGYSRALQYLQPTVTSNTLTVNQGAAAMLPLPYVTSIPVVVMPTANSLYGGLPTNDDGINSLKASTYQTRQRPPSLPFQIQWPLASFFPILIKDPLLHYFSTGGFDNLFEYGQNADVCNRHQKSNEANDNDLDIPETKDGIEQALSVELQSNSVSNSRQGRAIKKRTISKSATAQQISDIDKLKNIFSKPVTTTKKPVKKYAQKHQSADPSEGDLRFPFGDFTWFGNRKPTAPSPGFFINRLKVRRGGVAIAGPGGVATAGRGGTAVVGPGGLAYTQPGGLAVAGPAARVVALSSDADLASIISRLQQQYYRGAEWGKWRDWRDWGDRRKSSGFSWRSNEYQFKGFKKEIKPIKPSKLEDSFMIFIKPVAHAISANGVAIANPISHVVIAQDRAGTIVYNPVATAVVGPGGIAHAQSDLFVYEASIQYLPFYGGAKGQYLEVKKDNRGIIISEKIVSEENISSENVVKHSDENENLLSKVLTKNLQNLRSTSSSLLKLHNFGKRIGGLNDDDKTRFKTQLAALGEAASNTIKLIEEIGEDVDVLYKMNSTKKQRENYEDGVGEEGVGIDSYDDTVAGIPSEILAGATIAEAKPVGLAVVGENGLAASRPMATAVASSGIAIARPVATAIAGIDPSLLGINFQVNNKDA